MQYLLCQVTVVTTANPAHKKSLSPTARRGGGRILPIQYLSEPLHLISADWQNGFGIALHLETVIILTPRKHFADLDRINHITLVYSKQVRQPALHNSN